MMAATLARYLVARAEVTWARITGQLEDVRPLGPDHLPADCVPSFWRGDHRARVLAEIDQYGHTFPLDDCDRAAFGGAGPKIPRYWRPITVVLAEGVVCVEKGAPYPRTGMQRIRDALGWEFYVEAAALLRLRGLPCIPALREIDVRRRSIRMEFIVGRTLYEEIGRDSLTYEEIGERFTSMLANSGCATRDEIVRMLGEMAKRGVVPKDVHAANFIRGRNTGRLYMVDFHLAYFRPVPDWRAGRECEDSRTRGCHGALCC